MHTYTYPYISHWAVFDDKDWQENMEYNIHPNKKIEQNKFLR